MRRIVFSILALFFINASLAQNVTVKNIDQVLEETGKDQLNFVCSQDGLVVVNDKTFVTNVIKICFGSESIEFSCPASQSVPRSQDGDCDRLLSQS